MSDSKPVKDKTEVRKSDQTKQELNPKQTGADVLNEGKTDTVADKDFISSLYESISSVIGGDNQNEYLCLTLPGTVIDPERYKYDTSGAKPAHVKANESRLVNKMFDACFVTGADNGKMLPNQYKTALSMLSPKMNRKLFELKNQLRKVLMTPYPYDFGEGIVDNMTVEQVFYRLYNDYVEEKSKWSRMQVQKREELVNQIIDPVVREDKYLEWYGTVAEAERVHLEEKLGRVLNVFSPQDMNVINAILNCGVGGEIEQARSTLSMVEELSPDGGYVYPVSLYPDNWFNLLESSFTGMDLLESPAALSQRLRTLQMQRKNVLGQISRLVSTIPSDEKMKEVKTAYETANQKYQEGVQNCVNTNVGATADIVTVVVDMCISNEDKGIDTPDEDSVERVINNESKGGSKLNKDDVTKLINTIGANAKACSEAQADVVSAGAKCVAAAIEWCEVKNRSQLKSLLIPLRDNLESLNQDIEEVKSQIQISKAANGVNRIGDAEANVADVMPNKSDDYFTQIIINTTMSAVMSKSSKESSNSSSQTSASFFLGGYSSSELSSSSKESTGDENASMSIQIGMNVAKVQIERSWFDPGVFQLTKDMFSFAGVPIAPSTETPFIGSDDDAVKERFKKMNETILPAFPVALVIAKDVSIKFTSESGVSASFAEAVEKQASKGGGFLCFSSNSSSASSDSKSAAVANSNSNAVTVRFTAPQILGYYMQAIPEDKSVHITETEGNDMSIVGFISNFKMMMDDMTKSFVHWEK